MKTRLTLFSENLKYYLEKNNYSQLQLAKEVGTTAATVNRWVKGIHEPDYDTLLYICFYLEISPNELLGWDDEEWHFHFEEIYRLENSAKYYALDLIEEHGFKNPTQKDLDQLAKQVKKQGH